MAAVTSTADGYVNDINSENTFLDASYILNVLQRDRDFLLHELFFVSSILVISYLINEKGNSTPNKL